MQKRGDIITLPIAVANILNRESDQDHLIAMEDLRLMIEEEYGLNADRRSLYKAIRVLNETGKQILYERKDGVRGYRIIHPLTNAEALFILNLIQEAPGISARTADALSQKISGLLSRHDAQRLNYPAENPVRTDNDAVVSSIAVLLSAIRSCRIIEFSYYDLSISKKRTYRKENKRYHLAPYAIVSRGGRFYCIFHDEKHHAFANYRIDKMDRIVIRESVFDPLPFDLESHLSSSFQMYHGTAESVVLEISLDLANIVFDQFGRDIIISDVSEKTFTASIRTAVTPTLISWILMFEKDIRVIKPASLITQLNELAREIQDKYHRQNTGG